MLDDELKVYLSVILIIVYSTRLQFDKHNCAASYEMLMMGDCVFENWRNELNKRLKKKTRSHTQQQHSSKKTDDEGAKKKFAFVAPNANETMEKRLYK